MDARLQRRIQRTGWDRAAARYEDGWRRQLAPAQERLLALADLRPGERVLDVACGTGLVTEAAAAAVGPGGSVLGTDISAGMIALARERGGDGRVRYEKMDAEALELPDDSFDAALCALGLMYVPDPHRALVELRRVAGRASVAVWGARRRCGWAEIFPIVDARVRSEVCPMFFALGTGDALAAAFAEAGFADVVVERLEVTLDYASGEDACDAAFVGGPVALAYSRFDDATRRDVRADYLQSIAAHRVGDGYRVPGEFVLVAGRSGRR